MFNNYSDNGKSLHIDSGRCDAFSYLESHDLQDLLCQINNYDLEYRETLNLQPSITFSVEIEFENAKYKKIEDLINKMVIELGDLNLGWILEDDATVTKEKKEISYRGGEIKPKVLIDNSETWRQLKMICDILKKNHAIAGEHTGGHVHVGSQALGKNVESWINLVKMWVLYEKIIYRFGYGEKLSERVGISESCKPYSAILYNALQGVRHLSGKKAWDTSNIRFIDKHGGICFNRLGSVEMLENNTVEFRCPNGTLEEIIWQNNINFFTKLMMYCDSSKCDRDYIDFKLTQYNPELCNLALYNEIYLEECLELCDMLFDNNFDKVYFLRQYLKSFQYPKAFGNGKSFIKR